MMMIISSLPGMWAVPTGSHMQITTLLVHYLELFKRFIATDSMVMKGMKIETVWAHPRLRRLHL
jgi:hypothetical protein